ncbi:hypothetical protein WDU94_005538, partial [Cyamophila willieti]
MNFDNLTSKTSQTTANLFAKNFAKQYSHQICPKKDLSHLYDTQILINELSFTIQQVRELLCKLPNHACRGPDEISPLVFKQCADALAGPLTLIFQTSMDSGTFPDRWKISFISPIFKNSGERDQIIDYRPVNIASIIPKLFENLVSKKLYPILSSIVSDHQHGFMSRRSTSTNLVSF